MPTRPSGYPSAELSPQEQRMQRMQQMSSSMEQRNQDAQRQQSGMMDMLQRLYGFSQEQQKAPEELKALQLENQGRELQNKLTQTHGNYQDYFDQQIGQKNEGDLAQQRLAQQGEQGKLDWQPTMFHQQYDEGQAKIDAENAATTTSNAMTNWHNKSAEGLPSRSEVNTERAGLLKAEAEKNRLNMIYTMHAMSGGAPMTPERIAALMNSPDPSRDFGVGSGAPAIVPDYSQGATPHPGFSFGAGHDYSSLPGNPIQQTVTPPGPWQQRLAPFVSPPAPPDDRTGYLVPDATTPFNFAAMINQPYPKFAR